MKRFLFAAILLAGTLPRVPCGAQSMEDVIYFKNGAVLHGQIMEEDPSTWLKVKTADGTLHTYSMDDVTKILKSELPPVGTTGELAGPGLPVNSGPTVGQDPGTAFLLSFLVPGLGCYVNGGDDTKVGLISDGLYLGGLATIVAAGYSTTTTNYGYGYTVSTPTTTPFLWVGLGAAFSGWLLGMIDAPSYAASHQAHRNTYGDLFQIDRRGYELGLGLTPMGLPGAPNLLRPGSPEGATLALRF